MSSVATRRTGRPDLSRGVSVFKAAEIQSLIFPKQHWSSAGEVRAWLKDHDYATGLDETGASWRARQSDPGQYSRMRTICLAGSTDPTDKRCRIKAVVGASGPKKQIGSGRRKAPDEAKAQPGAGDVHVPGPIGAVKPFRVPILKRDDERQLVYGIVSEPDTVDSQGDVISAAEIEKAAHRFMAEYRAQRSKPRLMHQADVGDDAVQFVESYVAPVDFTMGDQPVLKGSWVLVSHVADDDLWGMVKKGELTGYSIGASVMSEPLTDANAEEVLHGGQP